MTYRFLTETIQRFSTGGVIVYVQDKEKLEETYNKINSIVKLTVLPPKGDWSRKEMIEDFDNKKFERLLSVDPVKTNREDIRAVIFFGMPKSIERVYKVSDPDPASHS